MRDSVVFRSSTSKTARRKMSKRATKTQEFLKKYEQYKPNTGWREIRLPLPTKKNVKIIVPFENEEYDGEEVKRDIEEFVGTVIDIDDYYPGWYTIAYDDGQVLEENLDKIDWWYAYDNVKVRRPQDTEPHNAESNEGDDMEPWRRVTAAWADARRL